LLLVTASSLMRPFLMNVIADEAVTNIMCVSPPARPATAGPAPPL
jgi:hypothetical protein